MTKPKTKLIGDLNALAAEIYGPKMNAEQRRYLAVLRRKVAQKEITVEEGHRLWNKKYFPKEAPA